LSGLLVSCGGCVVFLLKAATKKVRVELPAETGEGQRI